MSLQWTQRKQSRICFIIQRRSYFTCWNLWEGETITGRVQRSCAR